MEFYVVIPYIKQTIYKVLYSLDYLRFTNIKNWLDGGIQIAVCKSIKAQSKYI